MNKKRLLMLLMIVSFAVVALSTGYLIRKSKGVEVMKSDVVTKTLYVPLTDDESKSKETIKLIKEDYLFKVDDMGRWDMITNEEQALKDKVLVVQLKSYEGDEKSIDFTNRFASWLKDGYRMKDLDNDWSKNFCN